MNNYTDNTNRNLSTDFLAFPKSLEEITQQMSRSLGEHKCSNLFEIGTGEQAFQQFGSMSRLTER